TLLALAAWQRPHILPVSWAGLRAVVVPVLCTGAALGVLVYDHFGAGTSVGFGLACGTIVAAMARTLLTFREVRTLAETRIEARTDDLTGLTNRRYLVRLLEEAVAGDKGGGVTLLLVDLDHFKELNDTLGHAAGDELLRRIGPRLESALGPGDLLARLGGDEFGVLMPTGDVATATATAGRIRTSLEQPFDLLGISIQVGASVGVASTTEHGHDAATLLQRSDVAMYIAKERHTGVEVYDADRDRNDRDRLALAGQMRAAIASGEFVVHYQPKLDLRDDRIRSVEALVRWEHPVYGRLAPDAFLPIAEQTNQMPALTELVIEQALADASAWRGAGFELEVAINLSASNLLDKGLPKAIAARLAAHGIAGSGLRVEVTENSVLADPARSIAVLGELRAQGVGVSIDDFGTGQASLAYLTRLPADELKIDRVFVCDLATNPTNAAIVRSTCDLAEAIGLVVVGEGVEDGAALECLRELGCRRAQGFHIGMPMPAREVTGLLTRRAADGSATLTTG
ncbi:MAG: diguanylate cyclase, partial [Thermoleophilaceae bacterium]|nr:diguanylate cyclase [Thermoleophilaceae bacterium]